LGWTSPLVHIHQYSSQQLWNHKIAAQIHSHALASCLVPTHMASFFRDLPNMPLGRPSDATECYLNVPPGAK
jgi:hypothetical protein